MHKTITIAILFTFFIALSLSANCSLATKSECGAAGSTCKYFLWYNGTCIAPTNCSFTNYTVWSNASFNCVPCDSADQSLCSSSCAQWNYYYDTDQKMCTTCAANYGPLCLTCNSSQCLQCTNNFTLTTDQQSCFNGQCGIANCITCADSSSCLVCDSTQKNYNGFCVCSIANCQICVSATCITCFSGYALDSSKTKCKLKCMENCDVCTTTATCTTCSVGYIYDSTANNCILDCTNIDPNCLTCSTAIVCSSCNSNYTLDLSGTVCNTRCLDQRCITCTNSSNCTQCQTGYKVKLNTTTGNNYCSEDICEISFCIECLSATKCKNCATLKTLSNDSTSCVPDCNISNCVLCTSLSVCRLCTDGYKVLSGSCVSICSISNCTLCSTSATCLSCNDGFVLSSNRQACNYDCGILGCISCNSTTTCSQCYSGLTLGSNGAVCIVNCDNGFFLNATANTCQSCPTANCLTCDSIGKCLSCVSLYFLNSSDFTCLSCRALDANCFMCNPGNGICTNCRTSFFIFNGTCVGNTTCNVDNCEFCTPGNPAVCSTCYDGYIVADNGATCKIIPCPGGKFLQGSTCTCGTKSYFANGQCSACSDINCLSCTQLTCTSCQDGYYPKGVLCELCSSNCITCDSTGACRECSDGYVRNNGTCLPPASTKVASVSRTGDIINCPTGCKSCDLDSSSNVVCRLATDGYVLKGGQIYKCAQTCLTCAENLNSVTGIPQTCLSCRTGFNFADGICFQCTGTNALSCRPSNPAHSLSCVPGYNAESGTCKACGPNCIKCGSRKSGSCDAGGCVAGYFQAKGSSICVQCFNGCLVCGSDPNVCQKCSSYQYLFNGLCLPCGDNCVECKSASNCTNCESGYLIAASGACRAPNIDNCVSYNANIDCTKCDFNYKLTNGACILEMTCNATSSCKSCKSGFYLSAKQCFPCPTLLNCISCDMRKATSCSNCVDRYYVNNNGVCTSCPQLGCANCLSQTFCTQAREGYYLEINIFKFATGRVLSCGGLCATCNQSPLRCKRCQSGSSLTGTQCISDNNQAIEFTGYINSLGPNSTQTSEAQSGLAFTLLAVFFQQLAENLKISFEIFQKNTLIKSFKSGSVKLQMVMNQGTTNVDTKSTLVGAKFSDISVLSVAVVSSNGALSSVNLPLVLGIAIPLAALLIVIIVIFKAKTKANDDESKLEETEKGIEYQAIDF